MWSHLTISFIVIATTPYAFQMCRSYEVVGSKLQFYFLSEKGLQRKKETAQRCETASSHPKFISLMYTILAPFFLVQEQ